MNTQMKNERIGRGRMIVAAVIALSMMTAGAANAGAGGNNGTPGVASRSHMPGCPVFLCPLPPVPGDWRSRP